MKINGKELAASTEKRVRDFVAFLVSKGLTKQGACGLAANAYAESVINPAAVQTSKIPIGWTATKYISEVDSGNYKHPISGKDFAHDGIGFGTVQYTSSGRKQGYYNFIKTIAHTSIADQNAQWEYIVWEIENSYKKVYKVLIDSSKTVEECAKYVMCKYEAPKNQSESNQNKRANIGKDIYDAIYPTKAEVKVEKHEVVRPQFIERLTKPVTGEKYIAYYNTSKNNGLSKCCLGNKTDPEANVLQNCVGYANGRFNEIYSEMSGTYGMKWQFTCDAERFIEKAKSYGLTISPTPVRGSICCMQKGPTLQHGDGAGHVFIVEHVISATEILVSESGWSGYRFRIKTRSGKRWSMASAYSFRGFILNPLIYSNPYAIPTSTVKKGIKGNSVKWLQYMLKNYYGYELDIDGSFGSKTEAALKDYQALYHLEIDGKCGAATRASLLYNL